MREILLKSKAAPATVGGKGTVKTTGLYRSGKERLPNTHKSGDLPLTALAALSFKRNAGGAPDQEYRMEFNTTSRKLVLAFAHAQLVESELEKLSV